MSYWNDPYERAASYIRGLFTYVMQFVCNDEWKIGVIGETDPINWYQIQWILFDTSGLEK